MKEGQGGAFTDEADKVAFAFSAAIKESGDNLGQLLTVLEVQDEAVSGATTHLL